jgi:hypothetical protein
MNNSRVVAVAGLPACITGQRPRLANLRHSFAVQILLDWHEADLDVGAWLPILWAYLVQVSPTSTCWRTGDSLGGTSASLFQRWTGHQHGLQGKEIRR